MSKERTIEAAISGSMLTEFLRMFSFLNDDEHITNIKLGTKNSEGNYPLSYTFKGEAEVKLIKCD